MGIYNPCENKRGSYLVIYVIAIVALIIVGSLYETGILPKNQEYSKNSVWWYGFIGIAMMIILLLIVNKIFEYILPSELTKTHFWYISHILCYFAITLVSPGQWPFWLAIGITWELFECYFSCKLINKGWPIGCNGMYDIIANIAGIAIAMWIRSEIPITALS
jgi:hypothetical protein